ncbi:barstar family protein [Streptomyces roseicoloratus]|uniref:Barstar family protein n=1 Tax=Streptomyces roseicoloratus TaxID=2508722 RepID=A0ABY9S0R1_9ACTN|nr:barstar family protein [Streptomyces roseicoloratus]WMX48006.1 barstar family protein [Streptomyces roseicoloratus]
MRIDDAVVLDLHGVTDKNAFLDRCVRALPLPVWFGRNWDALADCLSDMREPMAIVVTGWQSYAEAAPDEWSVAEEVFSAAARASSAGLAVLLSLGGDLAHLEDRTSTPAQDSDDPPAPPRAPGVGQ